MVLTLCHMCPCVVLQRYLSHVAVAYHQLHRLILAYKGLQSPIVTMRRLETCAASIFSPSSLHPLFIICPFSLHLPPSSLHLLFILSPPSLHPLSILSPSSLHPLSILSPLSSRTATGADDSLTSRGSSSTLYSNYN